MIALTHLVTRTNADALRLEELWRKFIHKRKHRVELTDARRVKKVVYDATDRKERGEFKTQHFHELVIFCSDCEVESRVLKRALS